jgi:eukaryotic-like serine/threonine-protein kinase
MDIQLPLLLGFGDFELDVRARELRKHGLRIRLQDQSFQILLMLLDRPGEVVLREEIRQKLWPNNTIVEFDHSINAAIKRLRNALSESAEEPRYIETLAKRGYRFAGTVKQPKADPAPPAPDLSQLEGATISHYRILEKLGEGGMGVVWRAHDPRLHRDVAIKISAETFSDRFEREARAIAALNHPNICTLYDVGPNYLVMELIEGESPKGPLPLEEALRIARQIADALEAAHEKGIVHRDLKPGNIKIKPDGTVKVLDFGLAKTVESPSSNPEQSPTVTAAGMIMGTAAYMSPEQARGKLVDKRADIWAFGVVLYELLTGRRPFKGNDLAETLSSVMKDQPDLTAVPIEVRSLLESCLEKDPKKRLRDIGDVWKLELVGQGHALPAKTPRPWLARSAAIAAIAGLVVLSLLHFGERQVTPATMRLQMPVPETATAAFTVSPDGRKVALWAGDWLWVHSLESGETRQLILCDSSLPFWSPDSRFIGYRSEGKLLKIEATGGSPQTIADAPPRAPAGGVWNHDDVILFGQQGGFFRVPASGGVPVQVTALDLTRHEQSQDEPALLPDGSHFVYNRTFADETLSGIYVGLLDAKPDQQSSKPLLTSRWKPGYARSPDPNTGYLLFMREGRLMAQPLDNRRLELKGQPSQVSGRPAEALRPWLA